MTELERLVTARVLFVTSMEQVRRLYQPPRIVTIPHLERLTQLWNELVHRITTITLLATITRLEPANPEDFTSTLLNRMVTNSVRPHLNECFPPHLRQHQQVIIYTQMVVILHRLHYHLNKFIIALDAIVRW